MYGRKTFITQFFFFYSDVFLNSTKHFQTKLVSEADTFWTYMIKKKNNKALILDRGFQHGQVCGVLSGGLRTDVGG